MKGFNCVKIGTITECDGLSNLFSNSLSNETFIGLSVDNESVLLFFYFANNARNAI
jgi:hypothetical protein